MNGNPTDVPGYVTDRFALVATEILKLAVAPELIVYHFEFYGITGVPNSAVGDPLTKWLEARTGCDIVVGPNLVTASIPGHYVNIPLPASVMTFIRDFDAGKYPTLIATETGATSDV